MASKFVKAGVGLVLWGGTVALGHESLTEVAKADILVGREDPPAHMAFVHFFGNGADTIASEFGEGPGPAYSDETWKSLAEAGASLLVFAIGGAALSKSVTV
jgi:hypothetical protein